MLTVRRDVKLGVLLSLRIFDNNIHFRDSGERRWLNSHDFPRHGGIIAKHVAHKGVHSFFRGHIGGGGGLCSRLRSEEHTSELQSQSNLVCRLLLEKKKTWIGTQPYSQWNIRTTIEPQRLS